MRKYPKKLDYNTEDLESLTISDLKKLADYWLRQYLLENTERSNGLYLCPLTNKRLPEHKLHVSHYIDRSCYKLRWDLRNCHLISANSNTFDAQVQVEGFKSLHHQMYEEFLGEELVLQLKKEAQEQRLLYQNDYIEIIKKLRNE